MAEPATGAPDPSITPITELADPRVISMLSTEHWNLLTNRSLAYNEAFTRGGMFLSFLSMSFVGLALLAQAVPMGQDLLVIAAIVFAFDLVIGLTTLARINGANWDDLRALHGMARIRHGYIQIAPILGPYVTSSTHDDPDSVAGAYGIPVSIAGNVLYALSTSAVMVTLITAMVGGVLAAVVGLMAGASGTIAVWVGVGAAVLLFVLLLALMGISILRLQRQLVVMFPAPGAAD